MKTEIKKQKKSSLSDFLSTMKPLESFEDIDVREYVSNMRRKSRMFK